MATATPSPHPLPPKDPSPDDTALPQFKASASPNGDQQIPGGARRSSFNFLRRQKSNEAKGNRSVSGGKMSKKQKAQAQREELQRQERAAAMLPRSPPRLPAHHTTEGLPTFGGESARPDSFAIVSNRAGGYGQGGNFSRPSADYKMGPHGKVLVPLVPGSSPSNDNYDPYARTESMTHRSRYSYANSTVSTLNSPRRVRRRKDPTPFNILVVGTKSSGKTSFINFLRTSLALPAKKRGHTPSPPATAQRPDSAFTSEYLETEVDHERIGVTLWDSQGLEKNVVDLQLREMSSFLQSKFEETFTEEQKVIRAPGVRDTHIHCVFLVLDPARLDYNVAESRKNPNLVSKFSSHRVIGGLDEDLDLQVLRTLQGKTTVIPVISKADTITTAHMAHLKKIVWDSLKQAKLDPLEALNLSDSDAEDEDRLDERDEDAYNHSSSDTEEHSSPILNKILDRSSSDAGRSTTSSNSSSPATSPSSPPEAAKRGADGHRRRVSAMSASIEKEDSEIPYLPMSIISPDIYEPGVVGRKFPWGFADPYNVEHCDFVRLKDSVFSEWRSELREASRERWYEGWRTSRLKRRGETPSKRGMTSDGLKSKHLSPTNGNNGRAVSAGNPDRNTYR
ncbi:uncharacterized protein BDZ99DRAFT_396369 [Mytilinidion resinicola]|uniref:Septin-type G domain-containing protein n=1 Tax=Mytilinidion resinicola TaxID=574789 RepID=A0A6A6YBL9_9PEZI|nr:uncharacterized protein BDZ99DRAFT_396369 [Mytilinidion resinicola]KAF2805237.1 hypothetical protein BDZ99DRAFT_396369 [Mytilinidion resinicola]